MEKKKEFIQRLKTMIYWEINLLKGDMKNMSSCDEKKLFYHGMLSAYNLILSEIESE